MASDVEVKLGANSDELHKELATSQSSIEKWAGTIKSALIAVAAAYSVKSVVSFGLAQVDAAAKEAEGLERLNSVLKATGNAAGVSADEFLKLAAYAQKYHGVADDVYVSTAAILASFKNLNGAAIDKTIIAAADMATVLGDDLSSAATKLGRALNEPTRAIEMLRETGTTFTEEQKELINTLVETGDIASAQTIILDTLASRFGGAAADATQTFSGRMKQLKMSLGDAGEAIGYSLLPVVEALLPVVEASVGVITKLTSTLSSSASGAESWSKSWGDYFVGGLKSSAQIVGDTFSLLEFLWSNFGVIVEREALSWTLSVTSFVEDVKHLFVEVAPAYIKWFLDNWSNLLIDFSNFHATVHKNMWENVVSFFTNVWKWLNGDKADFKWVSLTDGFQATMDELPNIAQRGVTALEKSMSSDMSRLDNTMGASWNKIFTKNRQYVDKLFANDPTEKPQLTVGVKPPEVKPDDAKKMVKDTTAAINEVKIEPITIETKLGEVSGLEQLSKQITEGGKADLEKRREQLRKIAEENAKAFAAAVAKNSTVLKPPAVDNRNLKVPAPAADLPLGPAKMQQQQQQQLARAQQLGVRQGTKTLDDIYQLLVEQHPQSLKALSEAGSLA